MTTQFSITAEPAPMTTAPPAARTTAPSERKDRAPTAGWPITTAEGAIAGGSNRSRSAVLASPLLTGGNLARRGPTRQCGEHDRADRGLRAGARALVA